MAVALVVEVEALETPMAVGALDLVAEVAVSMSCWVDLGSEPHAAVILRTHSSPKAVIQLYKRNWELNLKH